jgi:hypothetical protein
VPPDAARPCHDHPAGEPDDPAGNDGRQPELDGSEQGSGRIGEQANDQPGDSASHASGDSGDAGPSRWHRQATYPGGEPLHIFTVAYVLGNSLPGGRVAGQVSVTGVTELGGLRTEP